MLPAVRRFLDEQQNIDPFRMVYGGNDRKIPPREYMADKRGVPRTLSGREGHLNPGRMEMIAISTSIFLVLSAGDQNS